jgi:phosphoglycolate phosphatase-like HAD superfamily hydrolase
VSLVLFDIDGTLLRGAGPHHKNALIDGVRRVTGLSATFEGIDTAGQLDRDLIVALLLAGGMNEAEIAPVLSDVSIECRRCYSTNCATDLTGFVCKGAREALVELRVRGAVLALVTGNLSEIGWRKMELAGLRDFFSLGSFSEDGATRTELARMAARRAREQALVSADCRVSLVGDHSNDIQAAHANGFQAIAVASGVMSAAELAPFSPDILLNNLSELDCRAIMGD